MCWVDTCPKTAGVVCKLVCLQHVWLSEVALKFHTLKQIKRLVVLMEPCSGSPAAVRASGSAIESGAGVRPTRPIYFPDQVAEHEKAEDLGVGGAV